MNKFQKFERKYGSTELLRCCVSILNQLLVEKGILTRRELEAALSREMKENAALMDKANEGK